MHANSICLVLTDIIDANRIEYFEVQFFMLSCHSKLFTRTNKMNMNEKLTVYRVFFSFSLGSLRLSCLSPIRRKEDLEQGKGPL